ncbi:MAG: hypothetical protein BGO07_01705 [Alphaproteobacteria bacterium 40-19]|nr:MAG: hypothetical protein BGO07_01705 [Alphaproteobacteria bacterium 40-19]
MIHAEPVFLATLLKYANEYKDQSEDDASSFINLEKAPLAFVNFAEAAMDLVQKGLSAYRRFKNNLAPGLDLSRLCLSEMGFNNQEFFLSSPIVKEVYPHINKDGICAGLSSLYALSCLPKDPFVKPLTLPALPCLASLEQLQGFGKIIYPHLSENWFWKNYNKILCAKSLSVFPAEERPHLQAFLNLTHFFQNMQIHPLQEVMDYFGFPVTVQSQIHYGKLDDETIKSALEKDVQVKNPCILTALGHATTLKKTTKNLQLYDPNIPSGLKNFSDSKEAVEDYTQEYDLGKYYHRPERISEWVYWSTLSAKDSSCLKSVGFKQKFLIGARHTRKRSHQILALKEPTCPLFCLCSFSELKMLFDQSDEFKLAIWDPTRGLYDYPSWGKFPGSVSKFYDFVMEQMKIYPNASAAWKIFQKIDHLTQSKTSQLHFSVMQLLPLSNDPKTWIEVNPGLVALANNIEKATTARRALCILEEYKRTL